MPTHASLWGRRGVRENVIGAVWGSSQPEQGPSEVSKAEAKGGGNSLLRADSVPQTTPHHLSSEQTLSQFRSTDLEHLRGILLERALVCILPFHSITQALFYHKMEIQGWKKKPLLLSKGVRAWFMALCPANTSLVGRIRVSARRSVWNLLNFSEPKEGLKESLILFSWCSLWQSSNETLANQQKQGFSLSASAQDTKPAPVGYCSG